MLLARPGVLGYVLMFIVLFGALPPVFFEHAVLLFFYGVYFGVLSRDLVDRLSEQSGFPPTSRTAPRLPADVKKRSVAWLPCSRRRVPFPPTCSIPADVFLSRRREEPLGR